MIARIEREKCTGCYVCVEVCGKDVLRFNYKESKAYIEYHEDCQTCFNCELHCPSGAVYVEPFFHKQIMPW